MLADSFSEQLAQGKVIEEQVLAYYRHVMEDTVTDHRDNPDNQRRDIDFEVCQGDRWITVDVKADSHEPVHFFLEDRYVPTGWVGRFWRSRAECWLYVFTSTRTAYVLPLAQLQRYVAERYNELRRVTVSHGRAGRDAVQVEGLLLPVRPTVRNLYLEAFTLPVDSQNG